MGRRSRDKGVRVELLCRDFLRRVWPAAYRTGLQWGLVRAPDVDGSPFFVECKGAATESGLHPWAALRQAQRDRVAVGTPSRPVLVYLKADRKPAVVLMLANEWLEREAAAALGRIGE